MIRVSQQESLLVPGDSHWSPVGHRLAADHLERQLIRLGVLPARLPADAKTAATR